MPMFMATVTGKPMMIPWPTYDREGVNHHIHFAARLTPNGALRISNTGIANVTGYKKLKS